MTSVEIYADGGATVGLGHLSRSIVLARAFANAGCSCVMNSPDETCVKIAEQEGFKSRIVDRDRPNLNGADILVADGYKLNLQQTQNWKRHYQCRLVIDDLGDRPVNCEILINPNIYGSNLEYDNYQYHTLLAGPDYALVNPSFRKTKPGLDGKRKNLILVSFGGTDDGRYAEPTARLLLENKFYIDVVISSLQTPNRALIELYQSYPSQIRLHQNAEMSTLMHKAQMFVGSAGTMVLEAFAAKIPVVVCAIANNQLFAAKALREAGFKCGNEFDANSLVDDVKNTQICTDGASKKIPSIDCMGPERIVEHTLQFLNQLNRAPIRPIARNGD